MAASGERRWWTAALFSFVAVSGMALQARGALLPSFGSTFGVTPGVLGLLPAAAAAGYLVSIVGVGTAVGRIDARRFLLVGVAGTALGAALTGLAPTVAVLAGGITVRMVATGAVRALDRPVLSHLYPANRGRIFNLHSLAWAVGAAAGPLLVNGTLLVGDWRLTYLVVALALLPLVVAVRRLDPPESLASERSVTFGEIRGLLDRPTVRVMAAALVLVVGVEASLFTWLPYYATGLVGRSAGNLLLSVYLLAYIPGRYAFARASGRGSPLGLIAASALGALVLLGVAVLASPTGPGLFVAVFGAGTLVSGLFPTLVAWGTDAVPEHSGPVNAIAMTAGQAGFFLAPAVIGAVAERAGIAVGMRVPLVLLAGVAALAWWRRR